MLTHFRINYLTNLTYFPIFLHFVDFFQSSCGFTSGRSRSCGRSAASRRSVYGTDPKKEIRKQTKFKKLIFQKLKKVQRNIED